MSILVSEQLRPKTFDDLVLSVKLRDRLERMYDTRNVMNMLFYGKPGSGKTTAAQIFTESCWSGTGWQVSNPSNHRIHSPNTNL